MYSIEGLKHGIEQAKRNIETFEKAIAGERQTIKEYRLMIDDLKKKQKLMEEAKVATIEVVRDDGQD